MAWCSRARADSTEEQEKAVLAVVVQVLLKCNLILWPVLGYMAGLAGVVPWGGRD